MSEISERIVKALKYAGVKQADFCKFSGLSQSAVSMLCSGKNNPSVQTKRDICAFCRVRMEWLETGEEPMEAPPSRNEVIAQQLASSAPNLPELDREILSQRLAELTDDEIISLAKIVRKLFI